MEIMKVARTQQRRAIKAYGILKHSFGEENALTVIEFIATIQDEKLKNMATKADIERLDQKTDRVNTELNAKIDKFYTELDAKIDKFYTELNAKMDTGFALLAKQIAEADLRAEKRHSTQIKWLLGFIIAVATLVIGGLAFYFSFR